MNKYQEALDYLRWIGGDGYYKKQREKSFDVLQESVDKETPMKPIFIKELGVKTCGSCKKYLASSNNWIPKYCSECGQKIDWSDEE